MNDSIELVSVELLQAHPRNPRKGNLDVVRESIKTNGFFGAVVAQKSTGFILAGNHRWLAAKDNGLTEVPVCWVDCDEEKALRILLADNRTSDLATYDDQVLIEMLQQLVEEDQGLLGTGYTSEDLAALLGKALAGGGGGDEDDTEDPPPDPISKPGDLWVLGKHRLLCGSSTSADDVERLLDGRKPGIMVTDPPYGVEYNPAWREEIDKACRAKGKVQNDDRADWTEAWALFTGEVVYCFHAAIFASTVEKSLEDCNFNIRSQIIWRKPHAPISRGHYRWQHEPCWYAVKKGGTAHWCGGNAQATGATAKPAPKTSARGTAPRSPWNSSAEPCRTTRSSKFTNPSPGPVPR